jgi:hypothetical protein
MKGCRKKNLRGRGVGLIPVKNPIFIVPVAEGMGHMKRTNVEFHGRISKRDKIRKKTKLKHLIQ